MVGRAFIILLFAVGILVGIPTFLIMDNNIRYEIQAKKILSNFAESGAVKEYLSNGVFQEDLECYGETGTIILKTSCIGLRYEVSNEACDALKSTLVSKGKGCDDYEWLRFSFKDESIQFIIRNSNVTGGKTVTFLVE